MTSEPRSKPRPPVSKPVRSERAPISLDVVIESTGKPPRFGTLENLSAGGACIGTKKPCTSGEVVLLHLPWPSRDEPTSLTAVVRWVEPKQMGLQFSMASPEQSQAIAELASAARLERTPNRPNASGVVDPFSRDDLLAATNAVYAMERQVRFQEIDAAGIVYYARIFEYFGDAYHALLMTSGVDVPTIMTQRVWSSPLVHAEADYLAPMRFGDVVEVSIVKVRCGKSAATLGFRITGSGNRALAVGHVVHVFVDGTTFRPRPIPPDVLKALGRNGAASS